MKGHTEIYCYVMALYVATVSLTPVESSQRLDVPDTVSSELSQNYQGFIDANSDGKSYTYCDNLLPITTYCYDGVQYFTPDQTFSIEESKEYVIKRHKNRMNEDSDFECSGCRCKFLGYSSAHNCKGKHVSCCTPQGPHGTSYGCTCYKKKEQWKMN